MATIESRLKALGLVLPPAFAPPPGIVLPFVNVRVIGNRAILAGHGPQGPEGTLAKPLGKVGRELTPEQGYDAAKLTALSMLGSLQRTLGAPLRVAAGGGAVNGDGTVAGSGGASSSAGMTMAQVGAGGGSAADEKR